MPKYTCQKCLKDFTQKSHYDKHLKKKNPCQNNKEKLELIVEEKVEKILENKFNISDKKLNQNQNENKIINNKELNNMAEESNVEKNKFVENEIIIKKINNTNNFIENINQELHNNGINVDLRFKILIDILNYIFNKKIITNKDYKKVEKNIENMIKNVYIEKNEIYQKVFMFYGSQISNNKIKLNQYYTPITIGEFISSLCIENKKSLDPACGTGDLIINYNGFIDLWDISKEVVKLTKLNFNLKNKKKYNIKCLDAFKNNDNNIYQYVFLNPPFGVKTVIKDQKILDNYTLGKNLKKQEIGILFIERSINLLKEDGIAFIILPNGYLGNSNNNNINLRKYLLKYRIIAIIELPSNTFSRSGTGVSTSLLIIQKKEMKTNYNIFVYKIKNIGYILNKKNTPYKYKKNAGKYILVNNKPVLDNDFTMCKKLLNYFIIKNNISNMNIKNTKKIYKINTIFTGNLDNNLILDIKRYINDYINVKKIANENNFNCIKDYIEPNIKNIKIDKYKKYLYLDLKQVNTPIYIKNNYLYGYELPSRAKISVKKNDIIISKLKGKIKFTIIFDEKNIICSTGFHLLRPKDEKCLIIIFGNLFHKNFKIQHNSLCTGSIMEGITNNDINNIYINKNIDENKYKNIYNSLKTINKELS